jgi:hypothetical protein
MAAVTLILVALLRNAELRADRAIQTKSTRSPARCWRTGEATTATPRTNSSSQSACMRNLKRRGSALATARLRWQRPAGAAGLVPIAEGSSCAMQRPTPEDDERPAEEAGDAPEDQPDEPGAEGGSESPATDKPPAAPSDDDSAVGDTDQHSSA